MKQGIFTVMSVRKLAGCVWEAVLSGDVSAFTAPGQFADVLLPGRYLRRPISVCDLGENSLTLVWKTVGAGTEQMSRLAPGDTLDLLTGLGNGYNLAEAGGAPLLVGGGAGVPPLYLLAKRLLAAGKKPQVILGFNTAAEVFYEEEFRALGADVLIATADGSRGAKGFAADAMKLCRPFSFVFCCGPEPMLRSVYDASQTPGQFSFEARMGCGFGACMGCSVKTKNGFKRICRDGPVLERSEILWQTQA